MRLRVTRHSHSRRMPQKDGTTRRRLLKAGDEFDGNESELKAFSDRLERLPDLALEPEKKGSTGAKGPDNTKEPEVKAGGDKQA